MAKKETRPYAECRLEYEASKKKYEEVTMMLVESVNAVLVTNKSDFPGRDILEEAHNNYRNAMYGDN